MNSSRLTAALAAAALIAVHFGVVAQTSTDTQVLLGAWRLASAKYNEKAHKLDAATVTLEQITPAH
jgi:tRNA G26 N,N-dimethylase Trm1